jgi:hypothetical protein
MSALMFIYLCTSVFAQPYTFTSSGSSSVSRSSPPKPTILISGSPSGSVLPSVLYTYPSSASASVSSTTTTSVTNSISSTVSPSITGTRLERVTVTHTVTQTVILPVVITVTQTISVTVTVTITGSVRPTSTSTRSALVSEAGTKSSDSNYIIIITFSVIGFVVALVIAITIVNVIHYKKKMANPMASSPKHVVYENRARFSVDSMPNNWHPQQHTQTRDLSV